MNKAKIILSRIIAIALVLGLSACGDTADTSSKSIESDNKETTTTISNAEEKQDLSSLSDTMSNIDSELESVDSLTSNSENESERAESEEKEDSEVSVVESRNIDYNESRTYRLNQKTIQGLNDRKIHISLYNSNRESAKELIMNGNQFKKTIQSDSCYIYYQKRFNINEEYNEYDLRRYDVELGRKETDKSICYIDFSNNRVYWNFDYEKKTYCISDLINDNNGYGYSFQWFPSDTNLQVSEPLYDLNQIYSLDNVIGYYMGLDIFLFTEQDINEKIEWVKEEKKTDNTITESIMTIDGVKFIFSYDNETRELISYEIPYYYIQNGKISFDDCEFDFPDLSEWSLIDTPQEEGPKSGPSPIKPPLT